MPSSSEIIKISCGEKHSLLLDDNGNVWSFGSNSDSQLGLGKTSLKFSETPVLVLIEPSPLLIDSEMDLEQKEAIYDGGENDLSEKASVKITQICCGSRHSLAIDVNGFGITPFLHLTLCPYLLLMITIY